jgi:hypothetical protein
MRGALICVVLATAALCYGQQSESKRKSEAAEAKAAQVAVEQTEAPQEERSFQLTFVARELDESGKVVNSRKFDTMVTTGWKGASSSIRNGMKTPVPSGGNGAIPQFQYVDIGANFDVSRPRIVKSNRLAMQVTAEISNADQPNEKGGPPSIRQNRWAGDVEVPIGGRKVIFSSDDLSSKKTMQIELIVTPVDR